MPLACRRRRWEHSRKRGGSNVNGLLIGFAHRDAAPDGVHAVRAAVDAARAAAGASSLCGLALIACCSQSPPPPGLLASRGCEARTSTLPPSSRPSCLLRMRICCLLSRAKAPLSSAGLSGSQSFTSRVLRWRFECRSYVPVRNVAAAWSVRTRRLCVNHARGFSFLEG